MPTDQTTSKSNDNEKQNETNDDNSNNSLVTTKVIDSLGDATKFSYAGLCATTLSILFPLKENSEFRHVFVNTLVAHLCLPSNVANTMQALCDGHGSPCTDVFVQGLLEDETLKDDILPLLTDLVTWSVASSKGRYDARTRVAIRHMTWRLKIKLEDVEAIEEELVQMLNESTEKEKDEQEMIKNKKARNQKIKRFALIGLATAGGGALIGLTGGLAAPLVAAGAGAILGGASAAALGSVAGLAVITSLFGAAGAGLTGYKMKQRVGGIDEFMFRPLSGSKHLSITVAVSGWLSNDTDTGFVMPWLNMMQSHEQYTLVWESKHLMRLGNAFEYLLNSLMSVAATEALKYTVLAGLITAVAWPASLLSVASVIDNPWSVCLQRSVQVGRQLAEVLLAREHGHRPVTLIGFSLGARVIYHCLEELAKRKNHLGIVEDVYLLGAPVSGKDQDWIKFSSVVSGHITNAYCRTDWLLRFLYRTSSRQVKVAGLEPITWDDRRMINIDLSSIVEGHLDYAKNMDTILAAIGVRTKEKLTIASGLNVKQSVSLPTIPSFSSPEAHTAATTSVSCHNLSVEASQKIASKDKETSSQDSNAKENSQSPCDVVKPNTADVINVSESEKADIFDKETPSQDSNAEEISQSPCDVVKGNTADVLNVSESENADTCDQSEDVKNSKSLQSPDHNSDNRKTEEFGSENEIFGSNRDLKATDVRNSCGSDFNAAENLPDVEKRLEKLEIESDLPKADCNESVMNVKGKD